MKIMKQLLFVLTPYLVSSLKFDTQQVGYNLNENQTAVNPLDYWGEWPNHQFHPSPSNWRFPFYTLFLDRFVNGDPSNDDANATAWEHDPLSNQFRHGGDLAGLVDTLDYIQGMGIKGLYIAGSPFVNIPWKADGYSPLDLTLLDRHFGMIADWRTAIDEIHKRGMYVVLDNTMSTMGDLIAFDKFENITAPFTTAEHKVHYKSDRQYLDFSFGNTYKDTCEYPRFWDESGAVVTKESDSNFTLNGCYDSEFDQYGDTEAFGVFPDWQRQLSKFASVQDRLREWVPSVREKIQHFSCMTIAMLDIDGFRFDKATQVTVDAQAEFGDFIRECAGRFKKDNFFMPGEITGGNTFGSIYLGRGRQPDQLPDNITQAITLTGASSDDFFLRSKGKNALDAAAFHYSIYRDLTRFLGMDGNLTAGYDVPQNFVDTWNTFLTTNDLVNANTGKFDPRHMYGVTNQDVFRWPAIKDGTQKMILGLFINTLHMPGIPLLLWGEEQAFYILDSTADNYIFGRQAISSTTAWQDHGCYSLGSSQYYNFPVDTALRGCEDDSASLDHRDPSHPVRNIIKSMYETRQNYPVLNDGFLLQSLSNQTHDIFLPGSNGTATKLGMWSVRRGLDPNIQKPTKTTKNGFVWLIYQNEDHRVDYSFNCSSNDTALIAPFPRGSTVKNILAPYDELKLQTGPIKLGIDGSEEINGCLSKLTLDAFAFGAYVLKSSWVGPSPMVTKFLPGHDARILSKAGADGQDVVDLEIQFSEEMDCDQITSEMVISSTTSGNIVARIDNKTVSCSKITAPSSNFVSEVSSTWTWKAKLIDVANGIHSITVSNATTSDGDRFTNANDHFLIRIGEEQNPLVFPRLANYSQQVLFKDDNKDLFVSHKAAGADKWRYSLNWGSSWSDWEAYQGGNSTLTAQHWSGTKKQRWNGDHVMLQYWSRLSGSSNAIQHADLSTPKKPETQPRRFPHLFAHGPFNKFGFDQGLKNDFELDSKDNTWKFHLMTEWPSTLQVNVWGVNPDKQPDKTYVYGNISNNGVLDRILPDALGDSMINFTTFPPAPHLAYRLQVSDATYKFELVPAGNRLHQIIIFSLLWAIPVLTGVLSIWFYMGAFYSVKFNKIGILQKKHFIPSMFRRKFEKLAEDEDIEDMPRASRPQSMMLGLRSPRPGTPASPPVPTIALTEGNRRTVLIATMEYDIEDWNIKIKIGGLGVMAQLMGKSLSHQDLIWVVPCVGGVEYPIDQPVESMNVTILGNPYEILVQYHKLKNITYVLLDAPIFRKQSKAEPYPPRMDDLDSAIYYSAWNACIAETIKRFPVDLYHINDYHGAAAPLYLLPRTIPVALSLHNAEFQGLWPMRTPKETDEVCKVFNLPLDVIQSYVQFGEVFNLLHAAASYLRIHQKGFGAVGVSNKYGDRSYARYPIFWGLKQIGRLPNPDPSDTEPWDPEEEARQIILVDPAFEASRGELRRQAQEWAGLNVDPTAELFVFVGRWSNQKGVDLIADVFPAVLEKNSKVQLICIGPVIDLYGKFAALKLAQVMKKYPGRVYSKPEFTQLPPFIFTGAEFALIPSRDEPFGLVAVEFGRKGALGVGARVGGLGQMPGWWFTVESTTTKHLHHQFKKSIEDALESKTEVRALMRARSAKQRFPVQKWVTDLNIIQSKAIKIHKEEARSGSRLRVSSGGSRLSFHSRSPSRDASRERLTSTLLDLPHGSLEEIRPLNETEVRSSGLNRNLSLGSRTGPGHRRSYFAEEHSDDLMPGIDESFDGEGGHAADPGEVTITLEEAEASARSAEISRAISQRGRNHIRGGTLQLRASSPSHSPVRGRTPSRASRSPIPAPLLLSHDRSRSLTPQPSPLDSPDFNNRMRNRLEAEQLLSRSASPPGLRPSGPETPRGFRPLSVLSLAEVTGDKKDFSLQKVDPTFNDTNGVYYHNFEEMISDLDGKNSEGDLCIEEYLVKSEKEWYKKMRDAKLGRSKDPSPNPSARLSKFNPRRSPSPYGSPTPSSRPSTSHDPLPDYLNDYDEDEFLLGKDYKRESFLKRWMLTRIGDWPIYSLLLALGQIIAANSYQITLLTGGQGETNEKLYIVGGIYIATSCCWWLLFRSVKSVYVLSLPFLFYGLAFLLIGVLQFLPSGATQIWMRNAATGMYVTASSSGSFFFALNFGDEGGAPIKAWVFRAAVIQGSQQVFVTALFYWGSTIASTNAEDITTSPRYAYITLPIAGALWGIGIILLTSLPSYYRQTPGKIPSFYKTLLRRHIIGWFFITVVLQNYFLSAPYGRNWAYLWSSTYAPKWSIAILVLVFFIVVWVIMLTIFGYLSKSHSWILPIFAIGLGAPRWAQMLWGTSGLGLWLPWMPGGPVGGAIAGRTLWLWLGVLDSLQGVGFGMMLLQTLTRIHIAVTLIIAQILGTAITMLAKGTAPDKDGPGDVFPDFSRGWGAALSHNYWFWIALAAQLVIPIGFFKFFRKEQLSKP